MIIFKRKYTLEGPAVAALGSIAGGLAAKALGADKGKGPTNGGGIPGLTSSKGQGKDGTGPGYATQVDPSIAIGYFKQAADAQAAGYDKGLALYAPALTKAADEIRTGYSEANQTLKPLSYASGQALNQQMRMLGLDPLPATDGFGDVLLANYNNESNGISALLPDAKSYVSNIANLMNQANTIKDTDARIKAMADIKKAISEGNGTYQTQLEAEKQAILNAGGPKEPYARTQPPEPPPNADGYYAMADNRQPTMDQVRSGTGNTVIADDAVMARYDADLARYNAQIAHADSRISTAATLGQTLSDYGETFDTNYLDNYDRGYTGDEVGQVVASLPGYQFNFDQGTKAIERQGAAAGMLGSGNTLDSLQKFGQGQSMSYYNQYMGYLSGITAQGAPATAQISANQSAQGTALATLAQNWGLAQMDTERQKANFLAKTLEDSGILFNQTAMFNAQQQNASILQGNQNQSNLMQSAIQSGPAYQNAATNYGQLQLAQQLQGFNMQQSQQYAQGFGGYNQQSSGYLNNYGFN